MRGVDNWEYCSVHTATYRDGTGITREVLTITLPGEHPAGAQNAYGLVGLLNHLGAEGWELVDVEASTFYLKRPLKLKVGHADTMPISGV
jgi:hypothetical protein